MKASDVIQTSYSQNKYKFSDTADITLHFTGSFKNSLYLHLINLYIEIFKKRKRREGRGSRKDVPPPLLKRGLHSHTGQWLSRERGKEKKRGLLL